MHHRLFRVSQSIQYQSPLHLPSSSHIIKPSKLPLSLYPTPPFLLHFSTPITPHQPTLPSCHKPKPQISSRALSRRTPDSLANNMTRRDKYNSSNSGGGGGGKGKFTGGTRPPESREVMVSKALSFVLRHGADREGIALDAGGWANVADLVCEIFSSSRFLFSCGKRMFLICLGFCSLSQFEKTNLLLVICVCYELDLMPSWIFLTERRQVFEYSF